MHLLSVIPMGEGGRGGGGVVLGDLKLDFVYNSILSEIRRQLVKVPLAAAISSYLISLTHPAHT